VISLTDAYIYYSDSANKVYFTQSQVTEDWASRWTGTPRLAGDYTVNQNAGKADRIWTVTTLGPMTSANWTTVWGWLSDTNALSFKSDWTSDTVSVVPVSKKSWFGDQDAAGNKTFCQVVLMENV
jgi:hypothetical protein